MQSTPRGTWKLKRKIIWDTQPIIYRKKIYQNEQNMWYIGVCVDDLAPFEKYHKFLENITGKNLEHPIENMTFKIPFRYRKWETKFYDAHGSPIISSDIPEQSTVSLKLECGEVWEKDSIFKNTWIVREMWLISKPIL